MTGSLQAPRICAETQQLSAPTGEPGLTRFSLEQKIIHVWLAPVSQTNVRCRH